MGILYIFTFLSIMLSNSDLNNNVKIPLYAIDGNNYIAASEYANFINSKTIFNKQKKKVELRFNQSDNIILSENSSFIKINNKIYHLLLPVLYEDDDFWIPILPFLNIINNIDKPLGFIDTSGKHLIL